MPTYQYACTACGHELEAVQSFTDDPLTQCPDCEGRLRKRFGSVGVVFKGPGFYRTDSRANANGAGKRTGESGNGKASGTSDSAASTSASDKKDSKPEKDSKPTKAAATSSGTPTS